MADLFMVVVSFNNYSYTVRAMESLIWQTVPVRTLVWDNNSKDGSAVRLPDWNIREVEIFCSPQNILWSPAINRAMERRAGEPYIGFMNNDIQLPPEAIERMLDVAAQPGVGLVAPMGARLGGPQDWAANMGQWTHVERGSLNSVIVHLPPKRVSYVVGACVIMPAAVWDAVGTLDEEMPLGADDHDYCIRVKQAGFSIWVNQNVYVNHAGHATGAEPEWNQWGAKSWAHFDKKWTGFFATEEEAARCHWGGIYHPGWDTGTGWLGEQEARLEWTKRETESG